MFYSLFISVVGWRLAQGEVLPCRVGIQGPALKWFESYLKDRTMSVHTDGNFSQPAPLTQGVLQGSISAPLLFTL